MWKCSDKTTIYNIHQLYGSTIGMGVLLNDVPTPYHLFSHLLNIPASSKCKILQQHLTNECVIDIYNVRGNKGKPGMNKQYERRLDKEVIITLIMMTMMMRRRTTTMTTTTTMMATTTTMTTMMMMMMMMTTTTMTMTVTTTTATTMTTTTTTMMMMIMMIETTITAIMAWMKKAVLTVTQMR